MKRITHVLMLAAVLTAPALAARLQPGAGPQTGRPPVSAPSSQAAPRRPAVATTGVLRGRVVAMNSDTPVRGAEVTAFLGRQRAQIAIVGGERTARTDDDGRFDLGQVPAGDWTVTIRKTGFVPWQPGQRRPYQEPGPVQVVAGRATFAEVAVPRGGAIAGRVYDEFTEPAANVRVNVYRARMRDGRRTLDTVGMIDQTDDTGAFRIHGLAPGEYYVAASLRTAPADSVIESTYAPTYFPGTGNLAEAQRIRLDLAAEAHLDFQLLPVRRVRVSGAVVDGGGGAARAFLNLVADGAELGVPLGIGGATLPDGTFTLPDVSPGGYTLYASSRSGEPEESAELRVLVGDDDVSGLTLVTAPPATIRGRFVTAPATALVPRGLSVTAKSSRPGGPMTAGAVSANGFTINAPPGAFQLEVHGLPESWTVQSATVDGIDATETPIALGPSREVTARVVLTSRVTDVRGTVRRTAAPRATKVVVFPEDPALRSRARRVRTAAVDAEGTFQIIGLPPGDRYLAVAVDYLEDGEGADPDFLAAAASRSTAFALGDGERRVLDLTVVTR